MKTPQEIYDYESRRIDKYTEDFNDLVNMLDVSDDVKDDLKNLYIWNGNARAIKSKAYQDMKHHG